MNQDRPHVTALASVSWDGRVADDLDFYGAVDGAPGKDAEGFFEEFELADAVLVDVSARSQLRVAPEWSRPRAGMENKHGGNVAQFQAVRDGTAKGVRPLLALMYPRALAAGIQQELKTELSCETRAFPVVVYFAQSAEAEVCEVLGGLASLRLCGGQHLDPGAIMRSLALEFAVRRLVISGGGALFGELLRGGCVDELGLSLRPQILGKKGGETLSGPVGRFLPASVKASLLEFKPQGGGCFAKWGLKYDEVRKKGRRKM